MLEMSQTWATSKHRAQAAVEVMERLLMACVRENLISARASQGGIEIVTQDGEVLQFPLAASYSMGRFDLLKLPPELERSADLFADYLQGVFPSLADLRRSVLLEELHNSYLNMALSLQALQQRGVGEVGMGSLADWESRVWCGHPLHPGARLRSGLSQTDNLTYGPEWGARLKLPILSVAEKKICQVGNFCALFRELFPSLGMNEPGRVLVPVHPWQAEHDLGSRFRSEFESGDIRQTPHRVDARPTMSFRTVILETETGEDFHLKLPIAVQTTGATRTVSVAATQNGPALSEFLEKLLSLPEVRDSRLFSHFHLMTEPASFYFQDEDPDRSRFLSAILRRGPQESTENKQRWILPVASLLEPRSNVLFERVAAHYDVTPLNLFNAYCRNLLPVHAFLCGQLGVALESHPQNLLVDFRGPGGALPDIHFWYRDLGGIRLHPGRLEEALRTRGWDGELVVPKFWPGSATSTYSDRDLCSKFIYSLLQNHLGELIRAATRETRNEAAWWTIVGEVLEEQRTQLGPDLARRVFATHWDLKSMWSMRVDAAVTEYTYASVESPLQEALA